MTSTSITRRACLALAFCLPMMATAQEHGTRDEAKAMVDAAIGHIKQAGVDKAYRDFGEKANTTWHKKDLYVFVIGKDGTMLSHGANEKLVGKDQTNLKDPNGKAFVQEMFQAIKKPEGGWVEYDWTNPVSKKIEGKASFVRLAPAADVLVGVGVYR